MDKLWILKSVEQAILENLEADGIRLYLLLLANSMENGEGNISYKTIRKALGADFHANGILGICRDLRKQGLIKITLPPISKLVGQDFTLTYQIVPACGNKK